MCLVNFYVEDANNGYFESAPAKQRFWSLNPLHSYGLTLTVSGMEVWLLTPCISIDGEGWSLRERRAPRAGRPRRVAGAGGAGHGCPAVPLGPFRVPLVVAPHVVVLV